MPGSWGAWTNPGSTRLSAVKLIYWLQVVVKESTVFIAECQPRRMGSSCSKEPNSSTALRERILKAVWERGLQGTWSARAQFSDWLASRWSFELHGSGFSQSGVTACGRQFSSGGEVCFLLKTTWECVSGLYVYLSGNYELLILLCGGFMVLSDTSFPAWQLFFVSISSHFPIINSRVLLRLKGGLGD